MASQITFCQSCTWIDAFSWKYMKSQLKKYRRVMSHDTERVMQVWWKTDLLFQKLQEFGELCSKQSILQNLHCDLFLLCKVYNIWPKTSKKELSLITLKSHAKFDEKVACGLENETRNLANFYRNISKCQNWYFDGIILS